MGLSSTGKHELLSIIIIMEGARGPNTGSRFVTDESHCAGHCKTHMKIQPLPQRAYPKSPALWLYVYTVAGRCKFQHKDKQLY